MQRNLTSFASALGMLRGLQGPSKSFSYLGAGNKLFGLQHKRVVARPYGSESLKTKDHRKRNIARAADEQVEDKCIVTF